MGRWLNGDPLGETGGVNIGSFALNNAQDIIDPVGTLTLDIKNLAEPTYQKMTWHGFFNAQSSLACECATCEGSSSIVCQEIKCTLTADPIVVLNANKELLKKVDSHYEKPLWSTEQHERNHHQVWLNVYVSSYISLISHYEGSCCSNCEERKNTLLKQYEKLKKKLSSWEHYKEYGQEGGQKEPNIDYGTGKSVLSLKDPIAPCKK